MPFPVAVGSRTFDSPTTLAAAALDDARAGGGRISTAEPPSEWLMALVQRGALDRVGSPGTELEFAL